MKEEWKDINGFENLYQISKVCREKAGTCKGYKWEYEY